MTIVASMHARQRFCFRVLSVIALVLYAAGAQAQAQTQACEGALYDCAVAQVGRQEYASARRNLERLLAKTPRDLKALNLLGITLTLAGAPEDANARFRQALTIDPAFHPARKNLAINELNAGKLTEAKRNFDLVLKQAPDDEVVQVHLGEIAFERKQLAIALTHYEKSRERLAQQPRWLLHYASCLLEARRTPEAVAAIDQLPPGDADAWFDAGATLGRYGAHADAARAFAVARKAGYKDGYAAGYNQTLMLIEAKKADEAVRVANELLATSEAGASAAVGVDAARARAELSSLLARAYAQTNRVKEAYDALRDATRLQPAVVEHYVDLVMLCLEHENYDLGLEIVDVGLKHRPDSSLLYLQRGVVLAMKGSVEQAESDFDRASKAAPDSPTPYVALAMVWMLKGQTPKAVEVLRARTKQGAKQGAAHPVLLYALGMALVRSGAAPDDAAGNEATEAFRTAVRLDPTFPQAQAELGKLLLKRGDVPGAIAHLEKAAALDPESSGPAYSLAQAYRRAGQTDRARELLARVSRLNAQERGDDPDTDLRRAVVRIFKADAATATPPSSSSSSPVNVNDTRGGGVRDAVAADPRAATAAAEVDAIYQRSTACAAAGDADGAIVLLRQVIAAAPAFGEARYNLGLHLWTRFKRAAGGGRKKEDLDAAVAQLNEAVRLEPSQASFQLVLGQLLAEQQHFAPAIEHLKRAVALAPEKADHPYNLGLALRLAGDLDAAEAQFRAALARNPDHAMARRSLGLVLRQKGDNAAAVAELRRAAALLPEDAQGHHLVGTVLLKAGDVTGAIEAFRQATRLDPSLIEAHVTLAQALAKSGQKEAALKEQDEVRRINAEKADFGRALVLLDSSAELMKKGDIAAAITQRREAVALAPSFAEAHYQLGIALRDARRLREAEAALRQAIGLDPTNAAAAQAALADVLDARGDTSGAQQARDRARALAPCSRP